ncbi:MAG: hypothetical protein R3Y28_01180 [Candidatus Gastranaerophilales bacterium]
MKNKMTKKIMASLLIAMFSFTNSLTTAVLAMEDVSSAIDESTSEILEQSNIAPLEFDTEQKPDLRIDDSDDDLSLQLRGDVYFNADSSKVSLSLRDSDVTQVLRMFADKAGMNIIFHSSASGNVTLDLVEVSLNSAFEMVMEIAGLTYMTKDNTIVVAKSDASDFNMSKQEMTLIPVKYIDAGALASFLNKNIYGIKKPGLSGTDVAVTNPATNEILIFGTKNDVSIAKKVIAKFDKKPLSNTFKVNHTTPAEMATMICDLLIPATTGGSSTGGAAGVVTGFASDGGDELTLNEATIACTSGAGISGSNVESLGLQNLAISYVAQLGTINILGGSAQQVEMIEEFIKIHDKKQPQAYLEVSILELNEDGQKTLSNQWGLYSSFVSVTSGAGSTQTLSGAPMFLSGDTYTTIEDDAPVEYSKHSSPFAITWAINYLLENQKGRVVANPRIIITNGQESTIDLTTDYIETTQTEMTASSGTSFSTRTYDIGSDAGIQISITPFISPDGYVTLNIVPEYATISSQLTAIDEDGNTYIQATLLQRRNLDLKNVRIKDGDTLVIGGLIQEGEAKTVQKVPILGDLPIIGSAFRSTSSVKSKQEMIIMITPKIIADNEDVVRNNENL